MSLIKKSLKQIALFVFFIMGIQYLVAQKVYTVEDVPNVHLQDRKAYVSDPEGRLSSEHLNRLNQQLFYMDSVVGVESAMIVLPEIDQEAVTFAHDLLNKWGVGNKETNKGLVYVCIYGNGKGSKRDIYMATGYGLEGDLPDAICKDIQVNHMVSYFKRGQLGGGLVSGVNRTIYHLNDQQIPEEFSQGINTEDNTQTESVENEEFENKGNTEGIIGFSIMFSILSIILWIICGTLNFYAVKKAETPYEAYLKDEWIRTEHGGTIGAGLIVIAIILGVVGAFAYILLIPILLVFIVIFSFPKSMIIKRLIKKYISIWNVKRVGQQKLQNQSLYNYERQRQLGKALSVISSNVRTADTNTMKM